MWGTKCSPYFKGGCTVMTLQPDERTILTQRLWESVKGFVEPDIEDEWLKEAGKRWTDIEKGRVQCIPAEVAMKRARESLRKGGNLSSISI